MVEITKFFVFIEDAAGGPVNGGVGQFFVLAKVPEVGAWVLHGADCSHVKWLGSGFFRGCGADEAGEHGFVELEGWSWFGLFGGEEAEHHGAHGTAGCADAGHFHVQAFVDEVGGVDCAPVGGNKAFEAKLVAEDFNEGVVVTAGGYSVDLVVGAHDGGDVGADGIDEGVDVDFMKGLLVDVDVGAVSVVGDVMLGLGHDALALHSANEAGAHQAGEDGIFAIGVVAAGEGDVAIDVDERLKDNVDAEGFGFAGDDFAVLFSVVNAEGGGEAHGGGFCFRGVAGQHARGAVGHAQGRDAEAGDAGEVAGLALVGGGVL